MDTDDGNKIVSHLFGSDSDDRVASLCSLLGSAQVQKLLGMLAPIVMGYIGGKMTSGSNGGGSILDAQSPNQNCRRRAAASWAASWEGSSARSNGPGLPPPQGPGQTWV